MTFRRIPPMPGPETGIERTLVTWARDTADSWSDLPEKPGAPGEEWRIEAKRDVCMVLDAQREIAKLRQRIDELIRPCPFTQIAVLCFLLVDQYPHLVDASVVYYWGRILERERAVPPSVLAFRQWILQHEPKYRGGVIVECVIPAEWKVGAA